MGHLNLTLGCRDRAQPLMDGRVRPEGIELTFLDVQVEETFATMGDDFRPYGLEPNRTALDTFLRYHHEQGLSPRKLEVEEMSAPETLKEFVI